MLALDGVIGACAIAGVCAAFVLEPVLESATGSLTEKIVTIAYPGAGHRAPRAGRRGRRPRGLGALALVGAARRRAPRLRADRRDLLRPGRRGHVCRQPLPRHRLARGDAPRRHRGLAARPEAGARDRPGLAPADRPGRVRRHRPRRRVLRLRRADQRRRHGARLRGAARRDRAHGRDLPRQPPHPRDRAPGVGDRRADRAGEPPPAAHRPRRAARRRAGPRARPVRPQRLQALQRHLRPPGRRRAPEPPRRPARLRGGDQGRRLPDGRRRVLRAARPRPGRRGRRRARRGRPGRARRGLRRRRLLRHRRAAGRGRLGRPRRCGWPMRACTSRSAAAARRPRRRASSC